MIGFIHWRSAAIFFALVLAVFCAALWLWGDPDRTERIYRRLRPYPLWLALVPLYLNGFGKALDGNLLAILGSTVGLGAVLVFAIQRLRKSTAA